VIWIVVAVVALAAAPLAAGGGASTAAPAAAKTSGTIIHPLPGAQVFPESVAVDVAFGRFWVTSVKDGTILHGRGGERGAGEGVLARRRGRADDRHGDRPRERPARGRRLLVVSSQFDTLGSPAAVSGT
jgi:hypothetical protein